MIRPAPGADAQEVLSILRLMAAPRLGRETLRTLLDRYGSGDAALRAVVRGRTGLPGQIVRAVESAPVQRKAERRAAVLEQLAARVLLLGRPGYPATFLRVMHPPPVLFCRGRLELLGAMGIAIIGTRRCTPYGADAAKMLAEEVARAGVSVVSGLARGIDAAAHRGALGADGPTVGVLGTGIDVTYPSEHDTLQEAVGERGLLLTEQPPGRPALPHQFPERNRLIAALSKGLVVVEAGRRSGTHKTVEAALDLGVEVMAVPGPIGRPQTVGTHQLIRDGAQLATCGQDIFDALNIRVPEAKLRPAGPQPGQVVSGPVARRLLEALGGWELPLDDLVQAAGVSMADALPRLLELEVAGRVVRLPGARFAGVPATATRVTATG